MHRILVVDDSEIARRELVRPLKNAGYQVDEAESGSHAVDLVRASKYDLIISDVHMPVMNGIEMCEALKADVSVVMPPIIVVSTESNSEMKARGKAAGVRAWVIKPVDGEKLAVVCKKLLE